MGRQPANPREPTAEADARNSNLKKLERVRKGKLLSAKGKQVIARTLWPRGVQGKDGQELAICVPVREAVRELAVQGHEFSRNKVNNVKKHILANPQCAAAYLAMPNTRQPPVPRQHCSKPWQLHRPPVQPGTPDQLTGHLKTFGLNNGLDGKPCHRTVQRVQAKLKKEFKVAEVHGKRYDSLRTNVSYDTCVAYIERLRSLREKYPVLADMHRWANMDEQGSHGNTEHYDRPTVWLVPVDDEGNYDPNGVVPRDYMHNSSSSGTKLSHFPLVTASGKLVWLALIVQVGKEETAKMQYEWFAKPRHPLVTDAFMDNTYIALTNSGNNTSDQFFNMFVSEGNGVIQAVKEFMERQALPLDEAHPFVITLDRPNSHRPDWDKIEEVLYQNHIILVRVPSNSTCDSNMLDNGVFAHFKRERQRVMDEVARAYSFPTQKLVIADPGTSETMAMRLPVLQRTFGLSKDLNAKTQIQLHYMLWAILVDEEDTLIDLMAKAARKCSIRDPQVSDLTSWTCLRDHRNERKRAWEQKMEGLEQRHGQDTTSPGTPEHAQTRRTRGDNTAALMELRDSLWALVMPAHQNPSYDNLYNMKVGVEAVMDALRQKYMTPGKGLAHRPTVHPGETQQEAKEEPKEPKNTIIGNNEVTGNPITSPRELRQSKETFLAKRKNNQDTVNGKGKSSRPEDRNTMRESAERQCQGLLSAAGQRSSRPSARVAGP
eukprot:scaffold4111_cov269-Prasinococcus_capsulatus_cf.AAC.2